MKILVVAATRPELAPFLEKMGTGSLVNERLTSFKYKQLEIDVLITGVGMVATAYHTGKTLNDSYDAAFNAGICGSFNSNLENGTVVNVCEDHFSELGAENDTEFLSLDDLKLEGTTKVLNESGAICIELEKLPRVNGITVNTTHGNDASIKKVFDRTHPLVESMEGAAFMFVCENERIPYAQIRAVSNLVEKRNRDAWNIPLAIKKLNDKLIEILDCL